MRPIRRPLSAGISARRYTHEPSRRGRGGQPRRRKAKDGMMNTSKLIAAYRVVGTLFFLASTPAVNAEQRPIDTANSVLTVRVDKAGAFSAFAHNHQIGAAIASGSVDPAAQKVEIFVNTASLKVHDPGGSDKDRAEIEKTMLGPEVLDAKRYHEIAFRSTTAERLANGGWQVNGNL